MPTWVNTKNRIITTIGIKIQTQRIFNLTGITVTTNKPTSSRIIVPRPKVNRTCFSIKIFAAITERISIGIVDILLNTESVISIGLNNLTVSVCKVYNISMSVLSIVGIFGFNAVYKLILCSKACSTNIRVCVIRVALDNICNDLFAAV